MSIDCQCLSVTEKEPSDFRGYKVQTYLCVKIAVFWVGALCNLVEVYQRFRGATTKKTDIFTQRCALIMMVASTSETSVIFCQTTRRNNSPATVTQWTLASGPKHLKWEKQYGYKVRNVYKQSAIKITLLKCLSQAHKLPATFFNEVK
jgi:hypothetical protein